MVLLLLYLIPVLILIIAISLIALSTKNAFSMMMDLLTGWSLPER